MVKLVETESRMVVARGQGRWAERRCLIDMELPFFARWKSTGDWFHHGVNALSATEVRTLRWLGREILCYGFSFK